MIESIPLPSETCDPVVLADWLELVALGAADGNSSHGDLQQALKRLGVENHIGVCTETMREINRRVTSTLDHYPFMFSGTLLKLKDSWCHFVPYIFCLLLSYCDERKKKVRGIRHEILFEQLSCIAAREYINGQVLRFGSPRNTLPIKFVDALTFIQREVNEWSPNSVKALNRKDGGLDLIAWRSFPDQQLGKLILFGHCASGKNWDEKINELQPIDFCSNWLGGIKSPIVKSFFIPHRVAPDRFGFYAISAKLFFDRCRIAYLVKSDEFCSNASHDVIQWCKIILQKVKE